MPLFATLNLLRSLPVDARQVLMLRSAALASNVVASIPIVFPLTKPASASRRRIHVKTASCVSRSIRRRVLEIVE
jgi:hypothetical protein